MLIGEAKMGQASEKTLSPPPGTHRALKHSFLTSVKPSPDETRSVFSFPTRAAVHRTGIAAAPPGATKPSNIWLCSSTSAGVMLPPLSHETPGKGGDVPQQLKGTYGFGGNRSTLLVFGPSLLIPSDYGVSEGRTGNKLMHQPFRLRGICYPLFPCLTGMQRGLTWVLGTSPETV